jgi:hypothetical protein
MNLQDDKDGGNDRSKVLDDILNYTLEIQRSNNSEKYGEWQELKQIKGAMKLNFLTTSGQSEEQRRTYFNNLYERRFNRIEQLINDFKSESESES